jgi:putative ABC transport system permease protein
MTFLRQLGVLLQISLLAIPHRIGLACTCVTGITCAVGVLVTMLAMGAGARNEVMGNVRPDRAVLLSTAAPEPMQSSISKEIAGLIHDLPGIRRNAGGDPIALSQVEVLMRARSKDSATSVSFPIIGSSAGLEDYAPELHLTSGRMYRPGLHELIASGYCARRYQGFGVGESRVIEGVEWLVVGHFDLGRDDGTCVAYADADSVLSALRRDHYNQVVVMLRCATAFAELTRAIESDPRLKVEARHEAELAEANLQQVNGVLNFVSYFVATILALAATIGAANSMYAMVDSRGGELATLRAVGFRSFSLIASILSEAILLAIPGALMGAGLAWLLFNERAVSPFGFQFHLAVTPSLVLLGIGWALCMGLIGGLMPALRSARVPVSIALRDM